MDSVRTAADARLWQWLLRTMPIMLIVAGLTMAGTYGWSYLNQTIFINDNKLAVYHSASTQLWSPKPQSGMKIGDLLIPSLQIQVPIVEGADPQQLKKGAGHYAQSSLPGQDGNVFLAGHRDTVFMKLKDLQQGDQIQFSSAYGLFTYEVTGFKIVPETDTSVLQPTGFESLTLQTCYPFSFIGSAPDRYIVQTKFIGRHNKPS